MTSAVAVLSQFHLTLEVRVLRILRLMPDLMQTHEARA